jgi:hypothetical protein
MKNFKRILKLSAVVFLMVLASAGIGLAGPIPGSTNKRRERDNEIQIEMVDLKKDRQLQLKLLEIKQ